MKRDQWHFINPDWLGYEETPRYQDKDQIRFAC